MGYLGSHLNHSDITIPMFDYVVLLTQRMDDYIMAIDTRAELSIFFFKYIFPYSFILHAKKTGFVVEHDFIMATYLADRVVVFEGEPSVKTQANR